MTAPTPPTLKEKSHGCLFLFSGVFLTAALTAGMLGGTGPNLLLFVMLALAVPYLFLAAAGSFRPSLSFKPWVSTITFRGPVLMYVLIAAGALIAPGLIADTRSTRAPTTESGARVLGLVMLAPVVIGLVVFARTRLRRRTRTRPRTLTRRDRPMRAATRTRAGTRLRPRKRPR